MKVKLNKVLSRKILTVALCFLLLGISSAELTVTSAADIRQNESVSKSAGDTAGSGMTAETITTEAEDTTDETTEISAVTTAATAMSSAKASVASTTTTATKSLSPSYKISVPYISQEGVLPTGCEIISTIMLLRYYHYSISIDDFINKDLDTQQLTVVNGKYYGPSPDEAFVGSPYSESGFGCYAPVIQKALNRVLQNQTAVNTTGTSLDDLVRRYISNNQPVLIWASMNMVELDQGTTWTVQSTGESFTWPANEHCLVLVGYDQSNYYFNDPYKSNGVKAYPKNLVNERFEEMGKQSVVVDNS